MPPEPRAVIYVRPEGALPYRQQAACLEYCRRHRYRADSLCHHPGDAVKLLEMGAVDVVIVAYSDIGDEEFETRVRDAGGRLEYARAPRRGISAEMARLVVGMFRRGADVPTIAHLLDQQTGEIRLALRRMGIQPPSKH